MKKLWSVCLLFIVASTAHAGMFINNTTDYDMSLQLSAHDGTLTASCSYFAWVEIAQHSARAYNNTADLNPHWTTNAIGLPVYAPISNQGKWDAAAIDGVIQVIGNPGSCAAGTSYTFAAMGTHFKATWTNLGGGNILIEIVEV